MPSSSAGLSFGQNTGGAIIQLPPGFCDRQAARRAVEQAGAKFPLDATDRL
jgi:hypothetical protein